MSSKHKTEYEQNKKKNLVFEIPANFKFYNKWNNFDKNIIKALRIYCDN